MQCKHVSASRAGLVASHNVCCHLNALRLSKPSVWWQFLLLSHLVQGSDVLTEVASQGRQVLLLSSVGASQVRCHRNDGDERVVLEL